MLRFVTLSLALVSLSAAAAAPSKDEVLRVVDYFNNGKGQGPVLLELTPCLKIDRPEGERKKRCVDKITGKVAKGTVAYVFLRFVVPRDDRYDDIEIEWSRDGESIGKTSISVSTSWSYGVWKARALTRAGKWTVAVKRGGEVLDQAEIVVE